MRCVVLGICVLLAGCTTAPSVDSSEPTVVSSPEDYAYLDNPNQAGHQHDYWNGQTSIRLLDTTYGATNGPVINGGVPVYQELPDLPEGATVPPGTAALEIFVSLTEGPGSNYQDPEIVASTPAGSEFVVLGDVGVRLKYNLTPEQADIPHAQISAWDFEMRFPGDAGVFVFNGQVTMQVTAHRIDGELPVFAAHPELWGGRSEIQLFSDDRSLSYLHYGPVFDGCSGVGGCGSEFLPDDGIIVPPDASHVDVHVTMDSGIAMTVQFHGADTYVMQPAELIDESNGRLYRIDVRTRGDSPYAETSLWAFKVRPETNVAVGDLHVEATVYRYPEPGPAPRSSSTLFRAS